MRDRLGEAQRHELHSQLKRGISLFTLIECVDE